MNRFRFSAMAALLLSAAVAAATEIVGVRFSDTHFTSTMTITIDDKPVKLVLTGVALRQKFLLNVYAIGSYAIEGSGVHTAEELAALDRPKQLHLVMERDVDGRDFAESFLVAIRQNYPTPAFNAEVDRLIEKMRDVDLKKGDHIYLTHLPGVGLRCNVVNKGDFTIDNPQFSRAVWDIYLGKNNVGESVKKGLILRLK